MKNLEKFDDYHWRMQIQLANKVFNEGDHTSSVMHYQAALAMGKKLFSDYKNMNPLPDPLTPVLVVSYLNLAECWAMQHKKKEQILCLIEIYDFLKHILRSHPESPALIKQAYEGLSKIFIELCMCFKDIDAKQQLVTTEEDFSELSKLFQSQLLQPQTQDLH